MLLERFPVSVGLVAGLVLAVTSVFALSLPVDRGLFATQAQPSVTMAEVRRVFARHGVPLAATPGLYVVAGRSHGPHTSYERRIGTIVVHYSGDDPHVLDGVESAVAALSRR